MSEKEIYQKKDNWFSRHGISTRIVVLFAVLVFVPFIVLAGLVVGLFRDYNATSLGDAARDSMSSVGYQIGKELKTRKEGSMSSYYNDIVEILSETAKSGKDISKEDRELIEKQLAANVFSTEGVFAVCVVDYNGNLYGTGSYTAAVSFMEQYKEEVREAGGRCRWYVTNQAYGKPTENKYILARSLNSTEQKHIGYLYMVMGDTLVKDAFEQLQSDESIRYLTDSNGLILYSSDEEALGEYLDISSLNQGKISDFQRVTLKDGRKVIMAGRKISETGWYCVSVIEMSAIMKRASALLSPFWGICGIYVVFLGVMLYMMQHYIFRPLSMLKKAMDQYAQGEFQTVQIEPVGQGELWSLSLHFNNMIVRIDNLMQNYLMEVEEKNRQKFRVLSAQLTPHFLYNALNTIKWVAVLNHQENIQKLIESLIYVLMNATKVDEDAYCVEDELKLIENYAVIQKARFMNFELVLECEEECRALRIRKLIVQPIVENAVVHGLGRGKIQNTEIHVKIWKDENLHIIVEDQGIGFDVEKWRGGSQKSEGHTNIGIGNVEEMIRLEYGEPYGMWIESRPGQGTKVTYLLPIIRRKEHDSDNYC